MSDAKKPTSWAEFLEHVEFKFPIPTEIRASFSRYRPDDVELRITMSCPDIATGLPTRVHTTDYPPPIDALADPAGYLRTQILVALAHEIDECLTVDGVKAYDPHTRAWWITGQTHPRYL